MSRGIAKEILTIALISLYTSPAWSATVWVTSREDSGTGTLRQALTDANNGDTIGFVLSDSITVYSPLAVSKTLTIDGQGTTIGATGAASTDVFSISSQNCLIKNLAVINSRYAFNLSASASYNQISGCSIGTDWADNQMVGNQTGVYLDQSTYNWIGPGNIISGNSINAVYVSNGSGNTITGNVIGANHNQSAALPNGTGISIVGGGNNDIGVPLSGQGNVISGNSGDGIYLSAFNNRIQNNYIGLNSSGTKISNHNGIDLENAYSNLIGGNRGTGAFEKNIISGNVSYGVELDSSGGNTLSGNFIGISPDGNSPLGNEYGVYIGDDTQNLVGGANTDINHMYGNVVSGQTISVGIEIFGGSYDLLSSTFTGNYIGTNASGNSAIPNYVGILTDNTHGTIIGGNQSSLANVISGNTNNQIYATNGTKGLTIIGNYIGVNSSGTGYLGNCNYAIQSDNGCGGFKIGGNGPGERNIICGNGTGMYIETSLGNTVTGNWLGVFANLTPSPHPLNFAICLANGCSHNSIGTKNTGQGNLIVNATSAISIGNCISNGVFGNTVCGGTYGGIWLFANGNNNKAAPVITSAGLSSIAGTSTPNDYIELFLAEPKVGQGGSLAYLGSTTTNGSGNWSFSIALALGTYVTALATDAGNNTSEFAQNMQVSIPPTPTFTRTMTFTVSPTPTMTPTYSATPTLTVSPTFSFTPTVTSTPSITPTFTSSQTFTQTPTATVSPTITQTFTVTGTVTMTPTAMPTSTSTITCTPVVALTDKTLAYPNPARNHMTFFLRNDKGEEVTIQIYNLNAERVANLFRPFGVQAGVQWNCQGIAPGIYFAKIVRPNSALEIIKIAVLH
jgi:hypothetical protein